MVTEKYHVEVTNQGQPSFEVATSASRFTIVTEGEGVKPLDAFLSALAACVGVYIRYYCSKNGVTHSGFTVTADSALTQERPLRFAQIAVTISLLGTQLDEEKQKALVAFVRRCPVHGTLTHSPDIEYSLSLP